MTEETLQLQGALLDTRPEEEKQRDYRHEEVAMGSVVNWREKDVRDLPFYELRDQARSGTCVAQSGARIVGIRLKEETGDYVSMSARGIYNRRFNQPASGMALFDLFKILKEFGATFEALEPSQHMSELEVTSAKELGYTPRVADLFKINSYFFVPNNIDSIADAVARGNPVHIHLFATREEYQINPRVIDRTLTHARADIQHAVSVIDYFLYKGKKYLLVEDSWGVLNSKGADNAFERELAKRGQRMFSEEFVRSRLTGAAYPSGIDTSSWSGGGTTRPRFRFGEDLYYGIMDSPVVRNLQDALKYEGCLTRDVDSTGNFLGLTQAAVQAFQRKYGIVSSGTPATTGYGRVGPKTRAKLNELFN